ncbi:MAG: hypothetical protein ACD_17C00031G0001 [uncultured bacterium]|nr:MAG: hypothetical protein ACD_17C00031G0001 [uncultured bacterium]
MVEFQMTAGGYQVFVDEKPFGYISRERGFFTDPTVIKEFVAVNNYDLRAIADKAEEVQGVRFF